MPNSGNENQRREMSSLLQIQKYLDLIGLVLVILLVTSKNESRNDYFDIIEESTCHVNVFGNFYPNITN